MDFMIIFIYTITIYGLCNMLAFGDGPFGLFTKFRTLCFRINESLYNLLTCMMCLPTYIGGILSGLNILFYPEIGLTPMNIVMENEVNWIVRMFFDSLFASGVVWLIHSVQDFIESNTFQNEE